MTDAFTRGLLRSSPLTLDDVNDLRTAFQNFCALTPTKLFVQSDQACRILGEFGIHNVDRASNGGVILKDGEKPVTEVNEEEFLLAAARALKKEQLEFFGAVRVMSKEDQARWKAARLFSTFDVNGKGQISVSDMNMVLYNMECGDAKGIDMCTRVMPWKRRVDTDDEDELYITRDEFIDYMSPYMIKQIPTDQ